MTCTIAIAAALVLGDVSCALDHAEGKYVCISPLHIFTIIFSKTPLSVKLCSYIVVEKHLLSTWRSVSPWEGPCVTKALQCKNKYYSAKQRRYTNIFSPLHGPTYSTHVAAMAIVHVTFYRDAPFSMHAQRLSYSHR